jgi:hypothetical protein
MFKAILFAFVLGVIFSKDVQQFSSGAAEATASELKSVINADAYNTISNALS